MYHGGWRPYVSVASRKAKAAKHLAKLTKRGHEVAPVRIEGRAIARTFWGRAWCENLERYSDYSNRLPRGRTYVRNGSVIDLQVAAGKVSALVQGSSLYEVEIGVTAVHPERWDALRRGCAGEIGSLVELLQGRFAKGVMERICARETGLFPAPREIRLSCSCPDWAEMCKHVAAVLYGVGARLDERPELLFLLRGVDGAALIPARVDLAAAAAPTERVLADEGLGELFGIDLGDVNAAGPAAEVPVDSRTTAPAPRAIAKPAPGGAAKVRKSRKAKEERVQARREPRTAAAGRRGEPRAPKTGRREAGLSDSLVATLRAAVRAALEDGLREGGGRRPKARRPATSRTRG